MDWDTNWKALPNVEDILLYRGDTHGDITWQEFMKIAEGICMNEERGELEYFFRDEEGHHHITVEYAGTDAGIKFWETEPY